MLADFFNEAHTIAEDLLALTPAEAQQASADLKTIARILDKLFPLPVTGIEVVQDPTPVPLH